MKHKINIYLCLLIFASRTPPPVVVLLQGIAKEYLATLCDVVPLKSVKCTVLISWARENIIPVKMCINIAPDIRKYDVTCVFSYAFRFSVQAEHKIHELMVNVENVFPC